MVALAVSSDASEAPNGAAVPADPDCTIRCSPILLHFWSKEFPLPAGLLKIRPHCESGIFDGLYFFSIPTNSESEHKAAEICEQRAIGG
jgi:hypothetical protein